MNKTLFAIGLLLGSNVFAQSPPLPSKGEPPIVASPQQQVITPSQQSVVTQQYQQVTIPRLVSVHQVVAVPQVAYSVGISSCGVGYNNVGIGVGACGVGYNNVNVGVGYNNIGFNRFTHFNQGIGTGNIAISARDRRGTQITATGNTNVRIQRNLFGQIKGANVDSNRGLLGRINPF